MPALPTLTVTQAQADRLMAAFGSVPAYQDWLKAQLVNKVITEELAAFDRTNNSAREAKRLEIQASLPPI